MTRLGPPPVLMEIVEQHLDELDFLWEQREANVFSADWALRDLAEHEERAEAHIDGLRIAGRAGVELAMERLATSGVSGATASTFVLWESGDRSARQKCLTEFCGDDPAVRDGIRLAFRHLPVADLREPLLQAMTVSPAVAAAARDVLTFHRVASPPCDESGARTDPRALKQILEASGRARRLRVDAVEDAMRHPDAIIRAAALRAAAPARLPGRESICRAAAAASDPVAVGFLGTLGDPADVDFLISAAQRRGVDLAAIAALGALGRVSTIPFLLELMSDAARAPAATAAYKRITGADAVEGERPFPPPPVADGEDEPDGLPPDPDKAKADWRRREATMTAEVAWQGGLAIPAGVLPSAFDQLSLESRRDVYLRGRASGAPVPDLELEARAAQQRAA